MPATPPPGRPKAGCAPSGGSAAHAVASVGALALDAEALYRELLRGGRELPVQADFAAARVALPPSQSLALARDEQGRFQFQVKEV